MNGNYPTRQHAATLERRLQDQERRIDNMTRVGRVQKDGVKYDKELKRWFVKLEDGTGDDAFKTDWLPWETNSSGWMKISAPPHAGQDIMMTSPGGLAEKASCRPYHNNQDNPSPSDKPGEYHMRIEKPSTDGKQGSDKNKILDFHYNEDGATTSIGDTTHSLSKDTISHKTKTNSVETEVDKTKASKSHSLETETSTTKASKSHSLETGSRTVKAEKTVISSGTYALGGKVMINC